MFRAVVRTRWETQAKTFGALFNLYLLPVLLASTVWGAIWICEWRSARRDAYHAVQCSDLRRIT